MILSNPLGAMKTVGQERRVHAAEPFAESKGSEKFRVVRRFHVLQP